MSEFHGDVGQAVMGDVNEAPRVKNVVHLNIGGEESKPLPITNLQRKAIAAKVKELMKLSGQRQLDIYAIILTDFGAENMDKFPRDRYKDAMALLDDLIVEAKGETSQAASQPPSDQGASAYGVVPDCRSCEKSFKAARDARRMTIMQTGVIIIAAVILGRLIISVPAHSAPDVPTNCRFEGKTYSVGSTAKMVNGVLRECLPSAEGGAPYWGSPLKAGR